MMRLLSLLLLAALPLAARSMLHGVDASCHAEEQLDFDGPAVSWGLDFKKPSAQECCDACKRRVLAEQSTARSAVLTRPLSLQHREVQQLGLVSHREVLEPGRCVHRRTLVRSISLSLTVWDHGLHECWLKTQVDPLNPAVNQRGAYAAAYREEHKTAPSHVQWMAGVII